MRAMRGEGTPAADVSAPSAVPSFIPSMGAAGCGERVLLGGLSFRLDSSEGARYKARLCVKAGRCETARGAAGGRHQTARAISYTRA